MKIVINIASFIFMGGVFAVIVYVLQKIVPVTYFKSVLWGMKNKRYILAPVSVILICFASIFVFSSFNFHFMLLFGRAEGVVVLGETLETMMYIDPMIKDDGLREHELIIQSVLDPHHYPGQTFKDAVNDRVLIKYPGHEEYNILFTHVIAYVFINLITVMFVFGSFAAAFFMMMYHAVGLGILKKPLRQDEINGYVKENLGISIVKALGIVTAVFVVSGIAASLISTRYNHVIGDAKTAADKARSAVLAKAQPGTVLKGEVFKKETFAVREYATRMDEGKVNRRTVSYNFKAYVMKFDDVYDYPVFVSVVYRDRELKPEVQKKVDMLETLLKTKTKGEFQVNENSSITLNNN